GGTSSPTAWRGCSREHPDLDVAVGDAELVLLQADVALGVPAVTRVVCELARLDSRLPIRAPELVLDDLHAVEPVLRVIPVHDDPRLVPLTGGFHDPCGRGVQAV